MIHTDGAATIANARGPMPVVMLSERELRLRMAAMGGDEEAQKELVARGAFTCCGDPGDYVGCPA